MALISASIAYAFLLPSSILFFGFMLQIEACLAVLKLLQYFPERKIFVYLLLSKSLFEDTLTDEEALCLSDSTCSVLHRNVEKDLTPYH